MCRQAAALGAGLIALWNRPSAPPVYATSAMVVLGIASRYAVLAIRPLAVSIARAPAALEDAARVCGAGYVHRMVRIVTPLHARAIAAVWILVLVFALRDLETAALLYPPGGATLTVRIFTLEANGPPGAVAGLAAVQVALTLALVALGLGLISRRSR